MTRVPRFRFDQRSLGIAALFCAGIFPAVLMWHAMVTNWVPLPFWDEWFTPGNQLASWCNGTLTLKELFSQHNESRKFFPRLLYLALAKLHGWDVRDAMLVTFASFCAMSALLYRTLRLTPRASTVSTLIAWTVMSFLCFAPVQFDNFLLGSQFEPFFPGLAVLAAANVNLSQRPFGAKIFVNIVLAVLATYTFANGMILWLLAIPLPSANHRITVSRCHLFYGIYAICAMVAVGGYFVGYARPSYHPPLALSTSGFIDLGHYFILWVGAYFDSPIVDAFPAGCFVVLIGVAVMTTLCILIWRSHEWRWCYPWLLLATYAVISGVTTAVGRLGLGLTQALEARYTVFSLSFYVAAVGAVHALYCRFAETDEGKVRRNLVVVAVLLMTLIMPVWSASYRERRGHLSLLHLRNRRLLRALEWIDVIPRNSDLALIFPYVDWLKSNVDILARVGVLRLPFVHDALAAAVQRPPHADDFTHGRIDTVKIERQQNLVVMGWAWLPERNRPPDCVVFGGERTDATFQLLGVVEPGGSSKDIAKQFHNRRMTHVAFWAGSNLEQISVGKMRIGAWAVDIESARAWPINAERDVGLVEWGAKSN